MKYSLKQYLGLLLVVVFMSGALVACGNSNKSVTSKVDCSKQAIQLKEANSDLEEATAKLKDAKGTPNEKQFKQAVDTAQATIDALGDCDSKEDSTSKCPTTWEMTESTPKNGDVVEDVPAIRKAKTKAEARAAANIWVNEVKNNPGTLKGAFAFMLDKSVPAKSLVDDKGCATSKAKNFLVELKIAVAASSISKEDAPSDGYNTVMNTDSGQMTTLANAGVGGDRTAIKVVKPNGDTVWIMARCGNPVTKKPNPHLPQPQCPPGSVMLPQGVCSEGKDANQAPVPTGGPVIHCPNGYLGRDGVCHTGTYTPKPQPGDPTPKSGEEGKGDSGPGATNTTAPPPTSAPEDPLPITTAPTEAPPPKP